MKTNWIFYLVVIALISCTKQEDGQKWMKTGKWACTSKKLNGIDVLANNTIEIEIESEIEGYYYQVLREDSTQESVEWLNFNFITFDNKDSIRFVYDIGVVETFGFQMSWRGANKFSLKTDVLEMEFNYSEE